MVWTKVLSGTKGPELAITLSEEAVDDSSKELIYETDIGQGSHMEITALRVEYAATGTAGTRTMTIDVMAESDEDLLYRIVWTANTLTASQTRTWLFGIGLLDTVGPSPQYVPMPPGLMLFKGQKLRIQDVSAIDAAADDMVVHVMGKLISR